MENFIEEKACLNLNNVWQPIGIKSIKDSINDLYGGFFFALDIEYEIKDNQYDYNNIKYINPLKWNEWVNLPIREYDLAVSSPSLRIRVPIVLIASRYSKMPFRRLRLTLEGVKRRDEGVCQYTGVKIQDKEGSVDHIIPKSRGGINDWDNLVYCSKKINILKSKRTPEEAGLKLIRLPKEPINRPICGLIGRIHHQDWKLFLIN